MVHLGLSKEILWTQFKRFPLLNGFFFDPLCNLYAASFIIAPAFDSILLVEVCTNLNTECRGAKRGRYVCPLGPNKEIKNEFAKC